MEEKKYRNPSLAVDAVIRHRTDPSILLISRKNEPFGWALPGGFVDYGESTEDAVDREVMEEVSLEFKRAGMLGVYSDPSRDPRQHVVSVVYYGSAIGDNPVAADDAKEARFFLVENLPDLCFDHGQIIEDYMNLYNKWTTFLS